MNPAARLLSIYDKLIQQNHPNGTHMVAVWAAVFGVDPSAPTTEDEVTICLQALRAEIDFVRVRLASYGVPEELLHPGFPRYREVTSPSLLRHP